MATSQNGWPAYQSASHYTPLRWITGRVDPRVHDLFDALCQRFNDEVEEIRQDWSWGWAYRTIRGASTDLSNHSSGTAIDLNAPAHPIGRFGTFSAAQRRTIHNILNDFPEVRWGGDYIGRKDQMHFEINVVPSQYEGIGAGSADGGGKPAGGHVKPSKPKPKKEPYDDRDAKAGDKHEWWWHKLRVDGDFGRITKRAYQRLLDPAKVGGYDGIIDGDFGDLSVKAEQRWLRGLGYYSGRIDGWRGPMTISAVQAFLYDKGTYRNGSYSKSVMVDGDFGTRSIKGLQKYLNRQARYYA